METNCSILISSCDSYADIWPIFFQLKDKYWPLCPYETYISTETKICPQAKTLTGDYPLSQWTRRMREALEKIPSKYVLFMDGDFFLREEVDRFRMAQIVNVFMKDREDIACFSFEQEYAPTLPCEFVGFRKKPNKSRYLNSLQASIWNREILISRLQEDQDPWQWEETMVDTDKLHFVNSDDMILDYGYRANGPWVGIRKGKWVTADMIPLMMKEGFALPMERGFYHET